MASAAESPRLSLPWPKGIRRWSRGPTLCKLFRKAKTSFRCKLAIAKLLGQTSSSTPPPSAAPPSAAAPPPLSPSQALQLSMQRSASLSSPSNSVLGGAIAIANCLRRHSDAIAPPELKH
ncbi:hypothetical protein GOP47_0029894 [Adiantum capillus-veneris]|nr:hypothetical protein GOP47_0029894 [Adiantum capillus-veneris]